MSRRLIGGVVGVMVALALAPAVARGASRELLAATPGINAPGGALVVAGPAGWTVVVVGDAGSTKIVKLHRGTVRAVATMTQRDYVGTGVVPLAAAIDRRGDVVVLSDPGGDTPDIVVRQWPARGRLLPSRQVVSANTDCSGCTGPDEFGWAAVDAHGRLVIAASAFGSVVVKSGTLAGALSTARLPRALLAPLAVRFGAAGHAQVVWSSAARSGTTAALRLSVLSRGRFTRTRTLLAFDRTDAWDGGYPGASQDGLLAFRWGSRGGWIAGWNGATAAFVAVSPGGRGELEGGTAPPGGGALLTLPRRTVLAGVGLGPDDHGVAVWAGNINQAGTLGRLDARSITTSGWAGATQHLGWSRSGTLTETGGVSTPLDVGSDGRYAVSYIAGRRRVVTVVCGLTGRCTQHPIGAAGSAGQPFVVQLTRKGARLVFSNAAGDLFQADVRP